MLKHLRKLLLSPRGPVIQTGRIVGSLFGKDGLTEKQIGHHIHILGASGFGKSVLLNHFIKDRIFSGKGMLYIDLKGDIETINKIKAQVKAAGREADFKMFSLSDVKGSSSYNLVASGTATQLRDRIMLSLNWSEEYYKTVSGSFLLKLLIGMVYLRDHQSHKLDLPNILKAISEPEYLEVLSSQIPEEALHEKMMMEWCYHALSSHDTYKALNGLRAQLESLILSDFGSLLSEKENGISIFEAARNGKLIFIFLDSRRYGESAKTVGKLILQDLKATSSRIDAEIPISDRKQFTVIIDEFADIAQEDYIAFLDRARSSMMPSITAHQEVSDLKKISEHFANRLLGNVSTIYCFLQPNQESAELISSRAGTRTAWKETERTQRLWLFDVRTGDKSLRQVEEFNIHPNTIKSLEVGECIVIKKYPESQSYKMKVSL